jgi:hypothetical protein
MRVKHVPKFCLLSAVPYALWLNFTLKCPMIRLEQRAVMQLLMEWRKASRRLGYQET